MLLPATIMQEIRDMVTQKLTGELRLRFHEGQIKQCLRVRSVELTPLEGPPSIPRYSPPPSHLTVDPDMP